jgi:hypothetical protein
VAEQNADQGQDTNTASKTSGDPGSAKHTLRRRQKKQEGLPLWMPILGLTLAFIVAIFAGTQICPVLSALVLPPDPRLPPGTVRQTDHVQKGMGLDEWVYATNLSGCNVALFYQDWLKNCTYDPDVSCTKGKENDRVAKQGDYHVVQCVGQQAVGAFHLNWTAYVATGYPGNEKTIFRLVREVSN